MPPLLAGHPAKERDPRRWREFVARYERELRAPTARTTLQDLARRAATGTVTLIYAARDKEHNDAVVLRDTIERSARSRANHPGSA
jgi:uncharacterized protein YeaO (DUF488 family)